MPRATTEAPSLADGPTLASTRDYWILHLRSEAKSERTITTLRPMRVAGSSRRASHLERANS